jgi:hypothetical protein
VHRQTNDEFIFASNAGHGGPDSRGRTRNFNMDFTRTVKQPEEGMKADALDHPKTKGSTGG